VKRIPAVIVLTLLFVAAATFGKFAGVALQNVRAQEKPQPEHKLIEFHLALLKRGPKWTGVNTADIAMREVEQRAYVSSLIQSGKAVIAGRLNDDGEIRGVYVLRAKSAEEARQWAEDSPALQTGQLIAEMHPWWSEDVMKKPSAPIKLTTVYLALLTRGAKWTPEKTPATAELQKAHMANIVRLAEMKKLVVAGPFGDEGKLRGIFVFKVASIDEARALSETDPAVQAGRLAIDIHPWLVPEGVLP
jgi:uncharacterized protein YciI